MLSVNVWNILFHKQLFIVNKCAYLVRYYFVCDPCAIMNNNAQGGALCTLLGCANTNDMYLPIFNFHSSIVDQFKRNRINDGKTKQSVQIGTINKNKF